MRAHPAEEPAVLRHAGDRDAEEGEPDGECSGEERRREALSLPRYVGGHGERDGEGEADHDDEG